MNTYALHAPDRDGRPQRRADDRQAALYAINAALLPLDWQRWSWTVFNWLALYDGFEQYVPPADDPVLAVSRVFGTLAKRPPGDRIRPADAVHTIALQPFMYHHAWWLDAEGRPIGDAWQPLRQDPGIPFWSFLSAPPPGGVEVRTQRLPMMHTDERRFSNWLMAGWVRFCSPQR